MPFNTLLLHHLLPDLSHTEQGIGVSLKKDKGEKAAFFQIDCDRSKIVEKYSLKNKCDILIYFEKNKEKTLCFVELKGSDFDHAVTQVCSTYQEVFEKSSVKKEFAYIKAAIILSGSAPADKNKRKLKNMFGNQVLVKQTRGNLDISAFLRNE